jgi:hypothetical protein
MMPTTIWAAITTISCSNCCFLLSATKSALGAIPIVGALLNEVVFDYRGRIKQERCNRFINELAIYMADVNETDIDIPFIKETGGT